MDIRQLRYFLAIAEEKHITAAAKVLNISQPPLSYQLKLLEEDLGVTLFVRGKESMELTPEGRVLQQHAQVIIGNFNAAMAALRNIREGISGTLHIGAIGSASFDYLPQSISRFLLTSPNAEFQIYEASSSVILNLLNKDVIELGIVKEPFDREKFNHIYIENGRADRPVRDGYYVALAQQKWFDTDAGAIDLGQLINRPLIIHRFEEARITSACSAVGFAPKIVCSDENVMTSITWALHGLGVAVIPHSSEPLVSNFKGEETLIRKRIVGLSLASDTVLIWKKNKSLSNIAQKYIDMLCALETGTAPPAY